MGTCFSSPSRIGSFDCECWTKYLAARLNRPLNWSANDLYAAQLWVNEESYPDGFDAGTPASRFAARTLFAPIERDAFRAHVLQYELKLNNDACSGGSFLNSEDRADRT
jgi:hypothetical protein